MFIIGLPDAHVEPIAMMVENIATPIASKAVLRMLLNPQVAESTHVRELLSVFLHLIIIIYLIEVPLMVDRNVSGVLISSDNTVERST